jgi:hypothetical protein
MAIPLSDAAASVPNSLTTSSTCFAVNFMGTMLPLFLELAVPAPRRGLRDFAALGARRFAARLHALSLCAFSFCRHHHHLTALISSTVRCNAPSPVTE